MPKTDTPPDSAPQDQAQAPAAPAEDTPKEQHLADLEASAPERPDDLMVADPLSHNGVFYKPGTRVNPALFTAEQLAALKKDKVLKFRHEIEDAAKVSADFVALQNEAEVLRQRIAELERKG